MVLDHVCDLETKDKDMTRKDKRPGLTDPDGFPSIFTLALTGYPAALIPKDREVRRPTRAEFWDWLDAGKPGVSFANCSLKYADGSDVGRIGEADDLDS